MALKLKDLIGVALWVVFPVEAATNRKRFKNLAALFVKDGNGGDLRFLGAGFSNERINQFIRNKQDFLEQIRPEVPSPDGAVAEPNIDTDTGTLTGVGAQIPATMDGIQAIIVNTSKQRRKTNRRRFNRRRTNKKPQIYIIRLKSKI